MTDDQIGDLRSAVYMIADARYIVEAIRDDMKLMGENVPEQAEIEQLCATLANLCEEKPGCIGEYLKNL